MIFFFLNVQKYSTHQIFRSMENITRTPERGACILHIITEEERSPNCFQTIKYSGPLFGSRIENCVFSFVRLSVQFHLSRSHKFVLFLGLVVLYFTHTIMCRNIDLILESKVKVKKLFSKHFFWSTFSLLWLGWVRKMPLKIPKVGYFFLEIETTFSYVQNCPLQN